MRAKAEQIKKNLVEDFFNFKKGLKINGKKAQNLWHKHYQYIGFSSVKYS